MQSQLLELAKQGDPKAIATVMNQALNTEGVKVQAALRTGCLHLLMESEQALNPDQIVPALRKSMLALRSPVIYRVRVYGRQLQEAAPTWSQMFDLHEDLSQVLHQIEPDLILENTEDEAPTEIRTALNRTPATHQYGDSLPEASDARSLAVLLTPHLPDPSPDARKESKAGDLLESDASSDAQERVPALEDEITSARNASPLAATVIVKPKKKTPQPPKLAIAGIIAAFLCGLGVGGWLLGFWNKTPLTSEQQIQDARVIVRQIPELDTVQTLAELEQQKQQLTQGIELLDQLPATADLQKQVTALKGRLSQVEKRLSDEQQAKTNLKMAARLVSEAEASVSGQSTVEGVNTAQQKLETAVRLLEVSPENTFSQADIQSALQKYQSQLVALQQGDPSLDPASSVSAAIPKPPNQVQPLQVTLNANGISWVKVITDSQPQYEGFFNRGMSQTWTAETELIVQVGSAGYMYAAFNGEKAKPMGGSGEVREIRYTPTEIVSTRIK